VKAEDLGQGQAGHLFDTAVELHEREVEPAGQAAADGCLAGAPQAEQGNDRPGRRARTLEQGRRRGSEGVGKRGQLAHRDVALCGFHLRQEPERKLRALGQLADREAPPSPFVPDPLREGGEHIVHEGNILLQV
jgi:hypothetical protein